MIKALLTACVALTFMTLASPASAQYAFDRRVDPSNCRWWQVCDYGGRAIMGRRYAWRSRCPVETVERKMPDGTFVTERRRNCAVLRVRG